MTSYRLRNHKGNHPNYQRKGSAPKKKKVVSKRSSREKERSKPKESKGHLILS